MQEQLGGCRVLGEIGRGAMGIVYRADRAGQVVALKVLSEEWTRDPAICDRFVEEGLIMGRLSHPGIVQVLDVGRDAGRFYLVLEFVEGPSFAAAIRRRAFTPPQAAHIVSHVGRALDFAHRKGVIHSDIVPGNILLKSDGTPKLTDFGIARLRGAAFDRGTVGVTAGTPIYMSPEQAAGMSDVIDVRSDVYSLGAVLYEAVLGRPPISGPNVEEILKRVLRVGPVPPRMVDPGLDPALERIILKAMDRDPARRYSGAGLMADALSEWARCKPDWFSMTSP
jgi:serine/threonine-protein kinase